MIRLPRNKVAVDPIFDRDKTPGGLWIPDQAKERCDQGIVKYIGKDVDDSIKIGSHVIFSGYTGATVRIDNELLLVIHQDFVKATIDVDDYNVSGLYCRGKVDSEELEEGIRSILDTDQFKVNRLLKLFVSQYDNLLIPAPYTTAISLIQQAHQKFSDQSLDIHEKEREVIDERSR